MTKKLVDKQMSSSKVGIHPLVEEVLFDQKMISEGVAKLAGILNKKYGKKGSTVVLVGVLKGCLPFMMELLKHLNFDLKIDFMIVTSYFGGIEKRYQKPKLILDADLDLTNCDVLIVEDIIETGTTIETVKKHLSLKKPNSIRIASLVYKEERINNLEIKPDFYVFKSPNKFLVGFGMDFHEKLRNLNYIGVLKQ